MRFLPTLSLLAVLLASTTARAERAALYLLAPGDADRAALAKVAHSAVDAGGWTATEPRVEEAPLADLFTCVRAGLADQCLPGYVSEVDAERAVLVSITVDGEKDDQTTHLIGWVFRGSGEQIATAQRFCDRCRAPAVESELRELVVGLVEEARTRTRPATLRLTSTPPGARVLIDDQEVGHTDLSFQVSPGRHSVRFELDGRDPVTKDVVVGDGDTMDVDVRLPQKGDADEGNDDDPTGTPHRGGSRLAPWLFTGGGAALLVAGGVLLAIDQDPSTDGPYEIRNTAPFGVGIGIAGAVVAGVGVYLLLRHPSHGAPVAAASSSGAYLGWIQSF